MTFEIFTEPSSGSFSFSFSGPPFPPQSRCRVSVQKTKTCVEFDIQESSWHMDRALTVSTKPSHFICRSPGLIAMAILRALTVSTKPSHFICRSPGLIAMTILRLLTTQIFPKPNLHEYYLEQQHEQDPPRPSATSKQHGQYRQILREFLKLLQEELMPPVILSSGWSGRRAQFPKRKRYTVFPR
jgi:hypothetical protein